MSPWSWYFARAGGLVAWGLLGASTVLGLLMTTKLGRARLRRLPMLDVHRTASALALVFTGVHVAALLVDTEVPFTVADALVPFASSWNPAAVAWGVVGLYLLLAVQLTSLARRSLPHRLWRRTHFLAFPLFVATTVHAFAAGTDTHSLAVASVAMALAVVVGGLVGVRVAGRGDGARRALVRSR